MLIGERIADQLFWASFRFSRKHIVCREMLPYMLIGERMADALFLGHFLMARPNPTQEEQPEQ